MASFGHASRRYVVSFPHPLPRAGHAGTRSPLAGVQEIMHHWPVSSLRDVWMTSLQLQAPPPRTLEHAPEVRQVRQVRWQEPAWAVPQLWARAGVRGGAWRPPSGRGRVQDLRA